MDYEIAEVIYLQFRKAFFNQKFDYLKSAKKNCLNIVCYSRVRGYHPPPGYIEEELDGT